MNILSKSNIFLSFAILCIATGCKKEVGPLTDNIPATPIIVSNAIAFRPEPTIGLSRAGAGTILITLSIPANSQRSFKSITKVAAATTFTQIQSTGTTGFYNTAAIPASGKTVNFTTTLAEYTSKTGQAVQPVNTELTRRFYFEVQLDDNSLIITVPVRVLMLD